MPKNHSLPVYTQKIVCSPHKIQRLKSLYREESLYYVSDSYHKQRIALQLDILYQHLNKIFRGNPIYRCLTQKKIDNLIQLHSYPFVADATEFVKKFGDPKLILEDLYVLLMDTRIDLKTTIDPIKTAIAENEAVKEGCAGRSDKIMQQLKLLNILINELKRLLNNYQPISNLFNLYYGKPIYYEDMVQGAKSKQTVSEANVNLNVRKFRELKWQVLALFNHLEYLSDQKLGYTLEDSRWFKFRYFFIRGKYSPYLQPYLFSSIKKNLERLVCFLALNNFGVDKAQLTIKKIIANDYDFYDSDWLPYYLTDKEAKASYIDHYIKKIDETICLSVDSLFARGFYLEREITPPAVSAFTLKLTSKRFVEKRSCHKRKQPYPQRLDINLTSNFFKASQVNIVNEEKKTLNAISIMAVNTHSSMLLIDEQSALQASDFKALHQLICNTIIHLGEYSIRIKRPLTARGTGEQKAIDNLRNYLLPLIARLFGVKAKLNVHSNKNPTVIFFALKVMEAFQELENSVNEVQKKDADFILSTSLPSLSVVSP